MSDASADVVVVPTDIAPPSIRELRQIVEILRSGYRLRGDEWWVMPVVRSLLECMECCQCYESSDQEILRRSGPFSACSSAEPRGEAYWRVLQSGELDDEGYWP